MRRCMYAHILNSYVMFMEVYLSLILLGSGDVYYVIQICIFLLIALERLLKEVSCGFGTTCMAHSK